MSGRERLLRTMALVGRVRPPRLESDFANDAVAAWRAQSLGDERPIEDVLGLDRLLIAPIQWRRSSGKAVVETEADLEAFRRDYDAAAPDRFPEGLEEDAAAWHSLGHALVIAPWNEGLLQVMGIADGSTLNRALAALRERPCLVEAMMEHYADYLDALIPAALEKVPCDLAWFYEPIASAHATVISPDDYRRFALPALKRAVDRLASHGVAFRVLRTMGRVHSLIPLWLEAGINGLFVNQTAASDIHYTDLRREYGRELRLFGGIDWRVLAEGPDLLEDVLASTVRPLLEDGGYVPHLDDSVRADCSFERYCRYRQRLDACIDDVCGTDRG